MRGANTRETVGGVGEGIPPHMIDYTLAKQLKDAGFPQREDGIYWANDGAMRIHAYEEHDKIALGLAYIPTLEELIEECGASDSEVFSLTWETTDMNWQASLSLDGENTDGEGDTAVEAVARLWLALNPRKVQ
jgi:hypothetical protein